MKKTLLLKDGSGHFITDSFDVALKKLADATYEDTYVVFDYVISKVQGNKPLLEDFTDTFSMAVRGIDYELKEEDIETKAEYEARKKEELDEIEKEQKEAEEKQYEAEKERLEKAIELEHHVEDLRNKKNDK